MPFGPLRSTRLLDAKNYYRRFLMLWVYSVAWMVVVVLFALEWYTTVGVPMKIALVVLLVLGTPTVGDLFQTYAVYVAKWEQENKNGKSGK